MKHLLIEKYQFFAITQAQALSKLIINKSKVLSYVDGDQ